MLNFSCYILLFLYLVDSSRTGRDKRIFFNTLTGWRTFAVLVSTIVSQVDGNIAGFTRTEISSDNLSIAGQYPWFIGQNIHEDHFELSKTVFWWQYGQLWTNTGGQSGTLVNILNGLPQAQQVQ